MKKELSLFESFYRAEEKIRQHIVEKNWPQLDRELSAIKKYGEKIEKAESDRNKIYQAMKIYCGEEIHGSFYAFISSYCPEKSDSLNHLYRELKVCVMKVKTLTMRIDAYLSTVTTAVIRVLDEIFPMRKGTIYNSSGINRGADSPPLVLDREL